jgi:hypothetical protein
MATTDKVCFDRILPTEVLRPHTGVMRSLDGVPTRAAFQIAKLWTNGKVLRIRFLGGSPAQQAEVQQYAPQWTAQANLSFDFGNDPNAEIRIAFNDDGAWSYIGTDNLGIPGNQPTMNFGWLDEGVILHEFGHMIGMIHEHQNPFDNPIQWNKPVVNAALSGPPNFWDQATIDHNIYAKYSVDQINGSSLDKLSVMLYSFPASWTLNGFHSEPNEVLSAVDKQFAAQVYPGTVAPTAVDLPVWTPVAGTIGQAGEEDLYTFTADADGRYTVETLGTTDLVMTLYAPNGTIVAQDDDSGLGRNPRIRRQLTAGAYKVQVRHYNQAGGTGEYGIRVVRE